MGERQLESLQKPTISLENLVAGTQTFVPGGKTPDEVLPRKQEPSKHKPTYNDPCSLYCNNSIAMAFPGGHEIDLSHIYYGPDTKGRPRGESGFVLHGHGKTVRLVRAQCGEDYNIDVNLLFHHESRDIKNQSQLHVDYPDGACCDVTVASDKKTSRVVLFQDECRTVVHQYEDGSFDIRSGGGNGRWTRSSHHLAKQGSPSTASYQEVCHRCQPSPRKRLQSPYAG